MELKLDSGYPAELIRDAGPGKLLAVMQESEIPIGTRLRDSEAYILKERTPYSASVLLTSLLIQATP